MNQVAEDKMPTGTMAGTPQVLLAHHLKQLKLPTVLREYEKRGSRPSMSVSYTHLRLSVPSRGSRLRSR